MTTEFQAKYAIGTIAYIVVPQQVRTPVPCTICGSTGKVTIQGEEFRCPKCFGSFTNDVRVLSALPFVVNRIQINRCVTGCQVRYFGMCDGKQMSKLESEIFATEIEATTTVSLS